MYREKRKHCPATLLVVFAELISGGHKGPNPKHDRSHVALIVQLVEHCTGNAKGVGSNPVQSLNFFQVVFPVVLWLQSHLSFFHYLLLVDIYYQLAEYSENFENCITDHQIKLTSTLVAIF